MIPQPLAHSAINVLTNLQWKVLVLDQDSKRLLDNVLDQDTILNENITSKSHPLHAHAQFSQQLRLTYSRY